MLKPWDKTRSSVISDYFHLIFSGQKDFKMLTTKYFIIFDLKVQSCNANSKSSTKWSHTCSKSILQISGSSYLQFCNLPEKFDIFLKVTYFLTVSIACFVYKQNFMAQYLKSRTAMEMSLFVICVEAIVYLLLYNLHDCTTIILSKTA